MRRDEQRGPARAGAAASDALARPHAPNLVGRDELLAELTAELQRACAGGFRVVLVTGAAGAGKTRLANELLEGHGGQALRLSARAYRWGATTSFGLWVEALDRHLRTLDDAALQHLSATAPTELAALFKPVAGVTGPPSRAPQRRDLLEALVDLFARLSTDMPVLVALDDLHLADLSSWEALRYLGRRLSDAPIGVVATARPGDLRRHPLAGEVLLGLEEDGLLHRVSLEPLRRYEVARLAHDILRGEPGARSTFVPEPLVTWLAERSMGQPLFIIGLLRALVEEGADLVAPRLERIPESLRERVHLELQGLQPPTRSVLEVLAVVERRIDLGDLAEIVAADPDELAAALEELCAARLVSERTDGTALAYEVAHPIVADTVYAEIGGARRRALHRTVARTLLHADRLGSAAGHYARAAEPGDDEAVDALCSAVAEAETRGLYQEALAALAALLEVLPADDPRWLRVLDAMAWQAEWVLSHLAEGDAGTAIAAMERIERHLTADAADAARGTVQLHLAAFLSFGAGRLEEAERACRRAIASFEAAGDTERVLLARNELAWIRGCGHDLAEHAALAQAVLDEATAGGHDRAAIQAAGTAAYPLGYLGRFDEAEELYLRSVALAREAGDTYRVAWGLAQRGLMLALAGRPADGVASVQEALQADPAAPDTIAYEDLAHCHWLAGDLGGAVAALEQSAVRRPVRGSRRRAWGAALAARLHTEMGLRGRADSGLEQARATYENGHILTWSCWSDWSAGFLAWHDGEVEGALGSLERAVDRLAAIGAAAGEALVLTDVAQVAAEAGEAGRCAAAAERLAEIAATLGGGLHPWLARLGGAWGHLAAGRPAEAADVAREAAAGLSAAGYALHHGVALDVLGRALEPGDRAAAVDAVSAAAGVFDGCGAVWRRDTALSRLGRLGSRGRRAAAAVHGPGALTPRERDVAQLAARGHTAEEIGEALFIGRRTVETHLANAYRKLGVTSKRELIRRADELDLERSGP
jgi:DNA-binding CsgD family transcriptional regulator/Tfp pilus assembly protein PilF